MFASPNNIVGDGSDKIKEEFLGENVDQHLDVGKQRGNILVKDNITRNISTPSANIKTFDTFMKRTIAKKNAPNKTKS
jgi:hypothetical protein